MEASEAWLKASKDWFEASEAQIEPYKAWLLAPETWLKDSEGGMDGHTDRRTKFPLLHRTSVPSAAQKGSCLFKGHLPFDHIGV